MDKALFNILSPEQAWHYKIIPKSMNEKEIIFFSISQDQALKDELEILLGKDVSLELLTRDSIEQNLSTYYRVNEKKAVQKSAYIDQKAEDILPLLISQARSLNSSDIHIEIYEEKCRVRIRIDGQLVEQYSLSKQEYPSLVNKIKIRSNLDISEKRLPQDGRIFFNESGLKFDIRVSVLPTLHGEKIVLRLLGSDATNIDIERLGFEEHQLITYLESIKKPHGILLVSGPTGSGKTTTLYATLKILNKEKTNIVTVEDPIEYTLEGINQVQLKESIGLTFSSALRTFLRQDPDVIMLGEIRDAETAQMAIRAALTGHLVLSTIHTNSALGTISRLMDMGVPGYLISNTLNISVAQRLVRLLCKKCKSEVDLKPSELPKSFKPKEIPFTQFEAVGCNHCHFTGYQGRKAIYEVLEIDQEIAEAIKTNNYQNDSLLKQRNVISLSSRAFELFRVGETSLEEAYPILLNHNS